MLEAIERSFRELAPAADHCSLRWVRDSEEWLAVRRGLPQPVRRHEDQGLMLSVWDHGGMGYAATADVSPAGLRRALGQARAWARSTAGRLSPGLTPVAAGPIHGEYETPVLRPWQTLTLRERIELLRQQSERLKTDARILNWTATLGYSCRESLYLTAAGGRVWQRLHQVFPGLSASANQGADTQTRSFGGQAHARQGGLEVLDAVGYFDAAPRIAAESLQLLAAPNCPEGRTDLLLAPDQMVLQIHESIGHPLELDRILGDERNYAGTSFVTLDMFGTYRYGSDLLNVSFDPEVSEELASYAFDDEGQPARRQVLIRAGILLRPLGGASSQARAGRPGVANARASGWNRPPIDRMANLNLEPGASSFEDLLGCVERGVYMETNNSWSIDDSRNKFQFGCEWGRLIANGELTGVVKNPGYRGISERFWRGLNGVGDARSRQVLGVSTCGKGEPNQSIPVGHATPPCLFGGVEVFGGG